MDIIELSKELIRFRSENPPGDQKPIADFLESRMKEIGLKVDRYDTQEQTERYRRARGKERQASPNAQRTRPNLRNAIGSSTEQEQPTLREA